MCFSCSFALLGFGLSRAGGREKKILNPRCPSWTHFRAAAPWIPGSLVSRLDTFPAGGSLDPRCPSWTHFRPVAPWIPGVQVGHILGRQLPGSPVSKLDTFPGGSSLDPWCPGWTHSRPAAPWIPGVQVGHISGRRLPGSAGVQVGHIPGRRLPESPVSRLDNDAAGEYRPSNCRLAGYGCIIKQP